MPVCETTDINKQTKIIIFNKPNQTDTWYKYYLYHVSVWFGSSEPLTPSLRAVSSSSTLGDTRLVVYETFINVINVFFVQTSLLSESLSAR